MKIAITGALGFLGRELVRYYSGSHSIVGIQHFRKTGAQPAAGYEAAVFDFQKNPPENLSSALKGCDLLFHCAHSESLPEDLPLKLLEVYQKASPNGKFIHVSSINVLVPALAQDPYTQTKKRAEEMLFKATPLIPVLIVRPPFLISQSDPGNFKKVIKVAAWSRIVPLVCPGPSHHALETQPLIEVLDKKIAGITQPGFYKLNIIGRKLKPLADLVKESVKRHVRGGVFFISLSSAFILRVINSIPYGRHLARKKMKLFNNTLYEPADDGSGTVVV